MYLLKSTLVPYLEYMLACAYIETLPSVLPRVHAMYLSPSQVVTLDCMMRWHKPVISLVIYSIHARELDTDRCGKT